MNTIKKTTESMWRVTLFGEIRRSSIGEETLHPVRFVTDKTRRLLAYLLLHPGRMHSREALTTLFWPDSVPGKGRRCLRDALYALRKEFETADGSALFLSQGDRVGIASSLFLTDVAEFEAAQKAAETATREDDRRTAMRHWEKAISLYVGPLLEGVYDIPDSQEWIEPLRLYYAVQWETIMTQLSIACAAQGRLSDALIYAIQTMRPGADDADRQRWVAALTEWRRQERQTQFAATIARWRPRRVHPKRRIVNKLRSI